MDSFLDTKSYVINNLKMPGDVSPWIGEWDKVKGDVWKYMHFVANELGMVEDGIELPQEEGNLVPWTSPA